MKNILLLLIVFSFLISCDSNDQVTISTKIEDPTIERILISNKIEMFYDTIFDFNSGVKTLSIEDPGIYQLGEGRSNQYVYLSPGHSIVITKKGNVPGFIISGDFEDEQNLLSAFSKEMSIANSKFSLNQIGDTTQLVFEERLEKRYDKVNTLLEESKSAGVSEDLVDLLQKRILADKAQAIVYYPQFYEYTYKRKADLTDDYYNSVSEFDFDDSRSFQFDDITFAGLVILAKDLNFEDYDNMGLYYSEQYKLVDKLSQNPDVRELLKYNILNDKINYAGGISGMEDEIQEFLANAKDPNRKVTLSKTFGMWEHLRIGNVAPDFSAFTRDDVEVKLSDLKGKNVYIDFWATWCGPCIAEIPYLQQMEQKYHDDNIEFVSVSIDKESDREKWKSFVANRSLGGTQIMANEAGSVQISTQYNISGIPRFMMIGANGTIVNVDAPRPSNSAAFNKMVESVLD